MTTSATSAPTRLAIALRRGLACRAIGGDLEIRVIDGFSPIPAPPSVYRWDEVDACISSPDSATAETTLRQILGIG
jgi:hypothetical protein